jgi:bifunctional non-homologous end joining protein LigD
VYQAQIEQTPDGGSLMKFQYGRRGATLQHGDNTECPVTPVEAEKIYNKLIAAKKAKGYSEEERGSPYAGTEKAGAVSGLAPQLLNDMTEREVELLLKDDAWCMQEKVDGCRLMIRKKGALVEGSNRKGLIVPVSLAIIAAIEGIEMPSSRKTQLKSSVKRSTRISRPASPAVQPRVKFRSDALFQVIGRRQIQARDSPDP